MLADGLSHLCSFFTGVQPHVTPEFAMNGMNLPFTFVKIRCVLLLVNSKTRFVQLQVYISVNSPLANWLKS